MAEKSNYVTILIEGLIKKIEVLDQIIEKNKIQTNILKQEKIDIEDFNFNVSEKVKLVDELNRLDEGFETVYERIKPELLYHKENYIQEIRALQMLISQITDRSVNIQAAEVRNKTLIEKYFRFERQEIRNTRVSSKVANDYYKSMSHVNYVDPQLMDKKR